MKYLEHEYKLFKNQVTLKGYTGGLIKPEGYFDASKTFSNVCKIVRFYVVKNAGSNLLGIKFFKIF